MAHEAYAARQRNAAAAYRASGCMDEIWELEADFTLARQRGDRNEIRDILPMLRGARAAENKDRRNALAAATVRWQRGLAAINYELAAE
jgi:hypothetical protein